MERNSTGTTALPRCAGLARIISGGQSGVDRAALDAAIARGIPHGGWCPSGRQAEDGRLADQYQMRETESTGYATRTKWNVRDSDGTLILYRGILEGGSAWTLVLAGQLGKPCLAVSLDAPPDTDRIREWIVESEITVLNVAGPRESKQPGIYLDALAALELLFDMP